MRKAAKLLFANFARHMFHARSAGSFDQDLAAVVTKNKDYEINQSCYTILLSNITPFHQYFAETKQCNGGILTNPTRFRS